MGCSCPRILSAQPLDQLTVVHDPAFRQPNDGIFPVLRRSPKNLQYFLAGRYRLPLAGGGWGMELHPDGIVATGPFRYTSNPMYLGRLIFMMGLSLTFWSLFAVKRWIPFRPGLRIEPLLCLV
jgi:hypothetical protein